MPGEITGLTDRGALFRALEGVMSKSGAHSLVVSDGLSERIFYFTFGGLREIAGGARKGAALEDVVVEQGAVSPHAMAELRDQARGADGTAVDLAVERGILSRQDLSVAVRAKVKEDLLELFLWEGAEVRLVEGQPPKAFYGDQLQSASLTCNVPEFLLSVLDHVGTWRTTSGRLPTGREIYEVEDPSLANVRNGRFTAFVALIDGTRTLRDAVETSGVRWVPAVDVLLGALREGKLRRVVGAAAQQVSREQYFKEMGALEAALETHVDATIVRSRLANVCEAAGEKTRAAEHWRGLGHHWRRSGDLDRALKCYRSAARLLPADFATRELMLEIHRHQGNHRKLIADGRPLAEFFLKHNLLERAKRLLLQLVALEEQDTGLRRQLVNVLLGLGERDLALRHLRSLARALEARNAAAEELQDVHLRILALDPDDTTSRKRLDEITGVTARRRLVWATITACVVVLAGFVGAYAYELQARRHFNQVIEEAQVMMGARRFDGARILLEDSLDRFDWSRSRANVHGLLSELDEIETELLRRAEVAHDPPIPGSREAAEAMADKAESFLAAGRLAEGHRMYRELMDLYPWAQVLREVRLPLRLSVLPRDAEVFLNGERVRTASSVISYSPRAKTILSVEREGFLPYRLEFQGARDLDLDVALSKPVRWTFRSDASFEAEPLVAGGTVYVAGRDRYLTALATTDGAVLWRVALGLYQDAAMQPVNTESGVVVTTAEGDALCVDGVTGEVKWRINVGTRAERQSLAAAYGSVVIPGEDGSLKSFSASTGAQRWALPSGTLNQGAAVTMPGSSVGFVDGRGVLRLASCDDGTLLPGRSEPSRFRGTPVEDNGRVWVWAADRTLRMLSTASLTPLKSFPVPRCWEHKPVIGVDVAYVVTTDGKVMGFKADGGVQFPPVRLDVGPSAPPTYAGGKLYVPVKTGAVYVLDARTGSIKWRFDAGSRVTAQPVVSDGTVYLVTDDGRVIALTQ